MIKDYLKIEIRVQRITLNYCDFQMVIDDDEEDYRNINVKITQETVDNFPENKYFDMDVYFKVKEESLELSGAYATRYTVNLDTKEELIEFIKERKQKLTYPVLCKISALMAMLSEQSSGDFPYVISPSEWLEDMIEEENENVLN